jgi:hypothetical protein
VFVAENIVSGNQLDKTSSYVVPDLNADITRVVRNRTSVAMGPVIFEGIESRTLPEVLQNLSRLPREIVHQILAELDPDEVLHMLSYNHGYLNSCILTSITYKSLLISHDPIVDPSQNIADLGTTIKLFMLLCEVCMFLRKDISGGWSPAQMGLISCIYLSEEFWEQMHPELRQRLLGQVHHTLALDERQIAIYRPYSIRPYNAGLGIRSQEYDVLRDRWTWITETWFSMRKVKSRQLNMAADLVLEFPGKLKRPKDPVQEGPRPNIDHIARRWRADATKYAKSNTLPQFRAPKCIRGADLIELIPYNRCLNRFLATIHKYPPQVSEPDDLVQFNNLSLGYRIQVGDPYVYPASIMNNLNFAINGLKFVHTQNDKLMVPRMRWARTGNTHRLNLVFCINEIPHSMGSDWCQRCIAKYLPYEEKEYEWLKAFLNVVTWMEKSLEISDEFEVVEDGVDLLHACFPELCNESG